jgi:hypothetical protein
VKEIGEGVFLQVGRFGGRVRSLLWVHPCFLGAQRSARIPIAPEQSGGWTIVVEEPLTLKEELHCVACGLMGRIVAGRWVPHT